MGARAFEFVSALAMDADTGDEVLGDRLVYETSYLSQQLRVFLDSLP